MSRQYYRPLTCTILLSFALHLTFWGSLSWVGEKASLNKGLRKTTKKEIEITLLEPSLKSAKQTQIVEQHPSVSKEKPKEAKYLSAENQKVEKETRARKHGAFNNEAGQNRPTVQNQKPISRTLPQTKTKLSKTSKKKPEPPTRKVAQKKMPPTNQKTPKISKQGDLAILKNLIPKANLNPQKSWQEDSHPVKRPSSQQQVQTSQQQGRPGRESASQDYLKDKPKGMQTLLNTHEFVYYSYYQRIRKKIQNFWEPSIKQALTNILAQGRSIASAQDRITKIVVVLDNKGHLVNIQVLSESGLHDLDDAAIEAFRSAEPFPNPPKGLAEKDDHIRIRWDFVLEV